MDALPRMDALLEELIRVPGIPGHEEQVRDLVQARLPDGVSSVTDTMGNLVAQLTNGDVPGPAEAPSGLMFVAHMDEIGFLVTHVTPGGFLRVKPLGGIDPRTVFGQAVRVVTRDGEVPGVFTVTPPHLMRDRAKEMKAVPKIDELLIDIGAESADDAAELGVAVLDFAVLQKHVFELAGGRICGRALDDRAGCYVLLRALERLVAEKASPSVPVYFAFSVQEEVGLRGAQLLARKYDLSHAFAIDSTSSADWPGVDPALSSARVGAGAALRVADNATVIPRAFRDELRALAEEHAIPLQIVFGGGGTDARPFQAAGPHVMSLAFPVRYTHSAVEVAALSDIEATVDLVCAIVRRYGG